MLNLLEYRSFFLMDPKGILAKIRTKTPEPKECFWALQIGFGLVKSAIWAVEEGLVTVLCEGEIKKWQSEDELLTNIDQSLSSAAEKLENKTDFSEPNKVVLGLANDWVKDNKITASRAKLLKKISKELSLDLAGFVVIEEAVVHRLKNDEGIPPSAILIYVEEQKVGISLVNLGEILGSELVVRSQQLAADLVEGLSRIKFAGVLPARILLYGADDQSELARQQLGSFSWQKANFLHLPKTESLAASFDISSVALAGGREIAQATGLKTNDKVVSKPMIEKPLRPAPAVIPDGANGMGFIKDQDIARQMSSSETMSPKKRSWQLPIGRFLPRRLSLGLGLVGFLLLIIVGGVGAAYWYLPKAAVTLLIKPKVLEKEFLLRLDPDLTGIDREKLVLPGEKIELVQAGEKVAAATGTKLIGEPAKGKATIYNGTAQAKIFAMGTKLISASGVEFSLDEAVTVASQSGSAAEPTPGQSEMAVTAVEIGTEGNFTAGTEFSVADYSRSDYVAKNEEDLTGGTSREVQVVAATDRQELLADLKEELQKEALIKLADQIGSGQEIIKETLTSKGVSQEFDHEAEAEAETVSLNLKLKFTVLSFRQDEFRDLIEEEIRSAVPTGFEYKSEESETSFELDEVTKKGVALFKVNFETKLLPIYDTEQIKKNLTGKKIVIGETYLNSLTHLVSYEVQIKPPLPFGLATFPRVIKNISVEILAQ